MREISQVEVDSVSGGDGVTVGVHAVGLGTSVAIGATLGPPGVAVAVVTYVAVQAIAKLFD